MKKQAERLLQDFVLDDRRLADRRDLEVRVNWDAEMPKVWPHGFAVAVITSRSPLQFAFSDRKRFCTLDVLTESNLYEGQSHQCALLASLVAYLTTSGHLQKQLGQHLKNVRDSLGLSDLSVSAYVGVASEKLKSWERGRCSPSGFEMYRWCQGLGLVSAPSKALVRIVDFSPGLLRLLQADPDRLRGLTPSQFELFVAERLDRMGYNVVLTGATNRRDGGIDFVAVPKIANVGSVVVAGQVKHHRDRKTEREAVDRLLAWKDSYFGVGLLVTNTAFTKDAVWAAMNERNRRFLRLRDFTDLKRWLEGHFGEESDWREIPTRVELAPGVVVEIPKPRINF